MSIRLTRKTKRHANVLSTIGLMMEFPLYLGGLDLLHAGGMAATAPQTDVGDLLPGGDIGGAVGHAQKHFL